MDSHPITTYDSVTRQKEPRASWMAENLAPDHWERYTQLLRGWQRTFQTELRHLQRHYNHSGVMSGDEHSPSLATPQKSTPGLCMATPLVAYILSSLWQNFENEVARCVFCAHHLPCGSFTLTFCGNPLSLAPIFLSHWSLYPLSHIPITLVFNNLFFPHPKFAYLGTHLLMAS